MRHEWLEKILSEHEETETTQEVRVCIAAGCASASAGAVLEKFKEDGKAHSCRVKGVGCMGLCSQGPLVSVHEKGKADLLYQQVQEPDVRSVLDSLGKTPVDRLKLSTESPFFQKQEKIVLENSGKIDPESLPDYIRHDGYSALLKALEEMPPEEVLHEVIDSGLRGRGGAGYPTGLKWTTVAKAKPNSQKYIICNADEGDPGAFMDRAVLESDPHRVLEGMQIAGYAVGANKGYIYIRGEYPLAIKHLRKAIRDAQKAGLLGHRVAGTTFDFDIEIRIGAGAFVCGEETALIASIEGNRGQPRPRPPYPADYGLWGCPTLINNVESLANVAPIIRNGGAWFAGIGTEKSAGTKVFALAGKVKNTGLVEVPMGITLREIVEDIGGGTSSEKTCKAVQTGGPSGGCIPEERFDVPVDYESLRSLGSIMGSGGMIVMDEEDSMVGVAHYFMEFCKSESCGKCVPCRAGTEQLYGLLGKFLEKRATKEDLELLEDLCDVVQNTSLCGLGQSAPNPVQSTLKFFKDEYLACLPVEEKGAKV